MPLNLYPKCWRDCADCMPIHCVDGVDADLTEEQMETLDYTPDSFVCSGLVTGQRTIKQDAYRLCFKNHCTDEMTDNDLQDLTSVLSVIAAALNFDAVCKAANGVVEIPAAQAFSNNEVTK